MTKKLEPTPSPSRGRRCANCDSSSVGMFCPSCGQRMDVDPKTLRYWLAVFADEVISLDGRLVATLRCLIRRPGVLTQEWLAGRQVRWTHPFRLYLLCSMVLFTASLLSPETMFQTRFAGSGAAAMSHALELQREALGAILPRVVILLVPLAALFMKVGFGWKRLYVEHFVAVLHLHAFIFLVMAIVYGAINLPVGPGAAIGIVCLVWVIAYSVRTVRQVYAVSWPRSVAVVLVVAAAHGTVLFQTANRAAEVLADDPSAALDAAEEAYWSARRGQQVPGFALVNYERLPSYAMNSRVRVHQAELLLLAGRHIEAGRLAQVVLLSDSTHLLALAVAARVAEADSSGATAREYWARYQAAFEVRSQDAEFEDHAEDLDTLLSSALAVTQHEQDSVPQSR